MQKLKLLINILLLLIILLLPFQIRFIIPDASSPQIEYLNLSFYFTEIFVALAIVLSIVRLFLIRKNKQTKNFAFLHSLPTETLAKVGCFFAFIFLSNLSLLAASNYDLYLQKFAWVILSVSFGLLILVNQISKKHLSLAVIFSGAIQSLLAIQQFITQRVFASKWLGMANQTPDISGVPVIFNSTGERILRVFGSLPHPNILGGFLALTLLVSVWYCIHQSKKNEWLALSIIINSTGLLLTFSRSALIATVVGLLIIFISGLIKKQTRNIRTSGASLILLTIIGVLIFQFSQVSILSRFDGTSALNQTSQLNRINQYQEALTLWKHNWILGVGHGNYIPALIETFPGREPWAYQPVHNSILLMIIEGGLGLITSLAFGLFILIKKNQRWPSPVVYSLFFPLLILALLDHFLYSFFFGLMLTSLMAAYSFTKNGGEDATIA